MTITIRAATLEDVDAITDIHVASWKAGFKGIVHQSCLDNIDRDKRRARWIENFQAYKIFLISDSDQIVGLAAMNDVRQNPAPADYEMSAIYIHPDFFGQGYGSQIFQHCLEYARDLGHASLYLVTLRDNPKSRQFYDRQGGKVVARDTNEYKIDGVNYPVCTYVFDL